MLEGTQLRAEENIEVDFHTRTRSGGLETAGTHPTKKFHTTESLTRIPSGSFGLFSDDETEDEKIRQERQKEVGAIIPVIMVSLFQEAAPL